MSIPHPGREDWRALVPTVFGGRCLCVSPSTKLQPLQLAQVCDHVDVLHTESKDEVKYYAQEWGIRNIAFIDNEVTFSSAIDRGGYDLIFTLVEPDNVQLTNETVLYKFEEEPLFKRPVKKFSGRNPVGRIILLPNAQRLSYAFFSSSENSFDLLDDLVKWPFSGKIINLLTKIGIGDSVYIYNTDTTIRHNRFCLSGNRRTTIIEDTNEVLKYPNLPQHAVFNRKESEITKYISNFLPDVHLPDGELHNSLFGDVWVEKYLRGEMLLENIRVNSHTQNLTIPILFLRTLWDETLDGRYKSRIDVDLEIPGEDIEPPMLDREVNLPQVVSHGDYNLSNIMLRPSGDPLVLDWEFGSINSHPILDLGNLLLTYVDFTSDTFKDGFHHWFLQVNQDSKFLYKILSTFAEKYNIKNDLIALYICSSHVNRLQIIDRYDAGTDYTDDVWPRRIEYIWNNMDKISNKIGEESGKFQPLIK
ncbi:phosphotransferase [Haloarcula sediminis]|uniref:phosphotransferase n=1 Tax=Haloarcula sediminis TaxID=3111777 RepID=UPI002D79A0F4|nr:phosphotransferase [Haloarcula sp. CK38]